jgi:hypothetical protein
MEEKEQLTEVSKFISDSFTQDESKSLIPNSDFKTLEEFKKYLTNKLAELLDTKYDTLINILYRIDVGEDKLSELFSGKNREYIPAALADIIIDRSLQKVIFRQMYKEGKL